MTAAKETAAKAFQKIQALGKDKQVYLKAACAFSLSAFKDEAAWAATTPQDQANLLFYPLKLACECNEEPVVLASLRAIQHLVSQECFDSSQVFVPPPVPVPAKKKGLFGLGGGDDAVAPTETDGKALIPGVLVAAVAVNMRSVNEEVQMEICRAMLTAVSAPQMHLHGRPLLLIVNACYGIYLHGRALAAATAKAALSQVGGLILQRADSNEDTLLHSSPAAHPSTENLHLAASTSEGGEASPEAAAVTAATVEAGEARMSESVTSVPANAPATTATDDQQQPVQIVTAASPHTRSESESTGIADVEEAEFTSSSERDIFLLLKSLSMIAGKTIENIALDTPEYRGRLQCLMMLQHCITGASDELKQKKSFRLVLRQHVARSLLQNCTSTHMEIARIALHSMQCLLCDLRQHLKRETQVFLQNIVFPILESSHSSYESRLVALQTLQSLFSTGQMVMDLFTNFDCSMGSVNLVADAVNRVAKSIQTSHVSPNWITPRQDEELRVQAVRIMSAITHGMVGWVGTTLRDTNNKRGGADAVDVENSEEVDQAEGGDSTVVDVADDVDRMLREKKTFEAILETFNKKKAKEGIALAVREGVVKNPEDAEEVAKFMLTTKGLDKVRIGEYLSANLAFIKEVLTAYIGLFDFTGLEVDEAMRLFLGKFKIQGEAETVDRTMECFATQYCHHNPDAFSSASTCYVLSFSIMMLNTDAHSAHIKDRMTLEGFLRNNRGIDDGKNLSNEFLEGVYTRITTNEIVLENAPPKVQKQPGVGPDGLPLREDESIFQSLASKKAQSYRREADTLVRDSIQQLASEDARSDNLNESTRSTTDSSSYIIASSSLVAKAFWDVAWIGMLPSLAVPMEQSTYEPLIDACIQGFDEAISLSCMFGDSTEREAFVSSLAAFTYASSRKEMEYKNVAAVRTLLSIANREGNSLQGAWYDVLKCISLIEKTKGATGGSDSSVQDTRGPAPTPQQQFIKQQQRRFEQYNAALIGSNFDAVEFDRIYSRSGDLDGSAIVSLVEAMCRVSAEELAEPAPRTHTLQRLVEVAEINIGRLRYVWSQMWVHLSKHFISVGVSKQQLVAMFVVDSLRQLSVKFLSREELGSLGFQRDFLKPFEVIASSTPRNDIRELVVASLGQMVDARAHNIHSGWHGLLNTLGKCASSAQPTVVSSAAFVLQRITLRKLHLLETSELLTDLVNAWSMFGGNITDLHLARMSVRCIRLLGVFAGQGIPTADSGYFTATEEIDGELQQKTKTSKRPTFASTDTLDRLTSIQSESSVEGEGVTQDTFADLRTWLSIFSALSSLTSVREFSIRNDALVTLFATIHDHVAVFSSEDWDMILGGTVQPIFENLFCDIVMLEEEHRDMEQNGTRTAQTEEDYRTERKNQIRLLETGLDLITSLYIEEHIYLAGHLPDLLSILISCTSKKDPQVTNAGLGKLQRILTSAEAIAFLTDAHWDMIIKVVKDDVATKRDILRKLEISLTPAKIHSTTSTLHALVRYLMALGVSLQDPTTLIPKKVVTEWMGIFMSCHKAVSLVLDTPTLAATINNLITGRIVLDSQRESCKGLVLCFGRVPVREQQQMEEWVKNILRRLATIPKSDREFSVIHEAVVYLLKVMARMPDDVFKSIAIKTYGSLCALIASADPELSKYLSVIFVRVGCASNIYTKTAQDNQMIQALSEEAVPSVVNASPTEAAAEEGCGGSEESTTGDTIPDVLSPTSVSEQQPPAAVEGDAEQVQETPVEEEVQPVARETVVEEEVETNEPVCEENEPVEVDEMEPATAVEAEETQPDQVEDECIPSAAAAVTDAAIVEGDNDESAGDGADDATPVEEETATTTPAAEATSSKKSRRKNRK